MAELTPFPVNDTQTPEKLLSATGSFWSQVFGGQAIVQQLRRQDLELQEQARVQQDETVAAVDRQSLPVFRRRQWKKLTLRLDEMNTAAVAPITFGSDEAGDYGGSLIYGQAMTVERFRFPLPPGIAELPLLLDDAGSPSLALAAGLDYRLNREDGYIEFNRNPFLLSVTRHSVHDADGELTEAMNLWGYGLSLDDQTPYSHLGYALKLATKLASPSYLARLNASYEALLAGPASATLRTAVAAACGLPFVIEEEEIVEAVYLHPMRLQIMTDRNVYDYPPSSLPTVAAGDVVHRGDILADTATVMEAADPKETFSGITGLTLEPTAFSAELELSAGLTFLNQSVATSYTLDGEDAVVTFPTGVTGSTDDKAAFWDYVAEKGAETGYSVAHALRKVEVLDPTDAGDPTEEQVVSSVNPMLFVLRQLIGGCLAIVKVDADNVPDSEWEQNLQLLRQLLPPHMYLAVTPSGVATVD